MSVGHPWNENAVVVFGLRLGIEMVTLLQTDDPSVSIEPDYAVPNQFTFR